MSERGASGRRPRAPAARRTGRSWSVRDRTRSTRLEVSSGPGRGCVCIRMLEATWADFKPVAELRYAVTKLATGDTASEVGKAAKALAATLDSLAGDSLSDAREIWQARPTTWSLVDLNSEFGLELNLQDNGDQAPTRATLALARSSCDELRKVVERWKRFVQVDLPKFNRALSSHGGATLATPAAAAKLCSL